MSSMFLKVASMSLTASYVALAVIIARFFLKKAPKIFSYVLWAVVLFRLLCPFTLESSLSLIPSNAGTIPENIVYTENPSIDTDVIATDNSFNTVVSNSILPANPAYSLSPMGVIVEISTLIWIAGVMILLIYGLVSYIKLKNKLSVATLVNDNIYETDQIHTPFVMGMIKPKIYIPVNIPNEEFKYILKHEQTHIKRYDYLIKYISFLALTIHWFNPLMWLSYFLMSKDMEMSCDESVMKNFDEDIRGKYSNSLLSLSVKQSGLLVPLSFGESNVKSRIKNILNYKKTQFWILAVVVVAVAIIAVVLGTNPINEQQYEFPLTTEDIENVLAEQGINMYVIENNSVDDWSNIANLKNEGKITFGIHSQVRNNHKVLNLTWYLYDKLTDDEVYDFFQNEISKQLELAGIFYGNKRDLDKELNKMLNYYINDKNYGNKLDWNEKAGNDHVKVKIKPMTGSDRNNIISLLIIPDELYDDYLNSLSKSTELLAQDTAKTFITDLYAVSSKEVDNYETILLSNFKDAKALSDAIQINDEVIKSLMTDEAYETLVANRQNLKYAQAAYESNYTVEVTDIQLSENKNNIKRNEAGYNFQVQLKNISHEGTEITADAKGLIELEIINEKWKVTGYKQL